MIRIIIYQASAGSLLFHILKHQQQLTSALVHLKSLAKIVDGSSYKTLFANNGRAHLLRRILGGWAPCLLLWPGPKLILWQRKAWLQIGSTSCQFGAQTYISSLVVDSTYYVVVVELAAQRTKAVTLLSFTTNSQMSYKRSW